MLTSVLHQHILWAHFHGSGKFAPIYVLDCQFVLCFCFKRGNDCVCFLIYHIINDLVWCRCSVNLRLMNEKQMFVIKWCSKLILPKCKGVGPHGRDLRLLWAGPHLQNNSHISRASAMPRLGKFFDNLKLIKPSNNLLIIHILLRSFTFIINNLYFPYMSYSLYYLVGNLLLFKNHFLFSWFSKSVVPHLGLFCSSREIFDNVYRYFCCGEDAILLSIYWRKRDSSKNHKMDKIAPQ